MTTVWKESDKGSSVTISNGGLTATYDTYAGSHVGADTSKDTGKIYWEIGCVQNSSSYCTIGIFDASKTLTGLYGIAYAHATRINSPGTYVLGFALDLDSATRTLKIYKNNVLHETLSWTDTSAWRPAMSDDNGGASMTATLKTTAGSLTYSPPAGYAIYDAEVKVLFENDGQIKKYVAGTGWSSLGPSPATEAMFADDGMTLAELLLIDNTIVQTLPTDNFKVLAFDVIGTNKNFHLVGVPTDRLVMPTGDINLANAERINSFTITANAAGSGLIKIVISVDQGVTWKTWNNTSWNTVTPTVADVLASGITPSEINALSDIVIALLTGTGDSMTAGIRFAYALSQDSISDTANTDNLSMNIDMTGYWDAMIHGTDYSYRYPRNDILEVKLLSSGDFKINY